MPVSDPVSEYYLQLRAGDENIFAIWERGAACGDSVTPSTWDPAYRDWIAALLQSCVEFDRSASILSVGCGNAFVESALVEAGYNVFAIDLCPEAVLLARCKGVP